jgi:hypothetical protein
LSSESFTKAGWANNPVLMSNKSKINLNLARGNLFIYGSSVF